MKNIAGKNAMKMKECIDFTGFSRSTIQKLIALTKKERADTAVPVHGFVWQRQAAPLPFRQRSDYKLG